MRLIQFRRHLTGYSVRVSDPSDVQALSSTSDVEELVSIVELSSATQRKLLSAEFYGKPAGVTTLDMWKRYIWGILKYRKRRGPRIP